jgi:hypothetical protein
MRNVQHHQKQEAHSAYTPFPCKVTENELKMQSKYEAAIKPDIRYVHDCPLRLGSSTTERMLDVPATHEEQHAAARTHLRHSSLWCHSIGIKGKELLQMHEGAGGHLHWPGS